MDNVKKRRQSGGNSSEMINRVSSIGTEELGHLEMIGAIVHQLTRNLSREQIMNSGFAPYYVDHTTGIYPTAASGFPWTAASMQSKGDPITDLHEDLAAEQKARTTYDNILRMCDDPDVRDPIKFLRAREIVHYQRFGEAMLPDLNGFSLRKPLENHISFTNTQQKRLGKSRLFPKRSSQV